VRVLIIKTSSLGDIVHTFPAVTDAAIRIPNFNCDWVVEENFAALPTLHSAINTVITIALRRWKRSMLTTLINGEVLTFVNQLRNTNYDLVVDAQGLYKSAILTILARGISAGFDYYSARESWVSYSYHHKINVPIQLHAITRLRYLFAQAFNYQMPTDAPNFGLMTIYPTITKPYLIFIPATTWFSKHYPLTHWVELINLANNTGYTVFIAWYTEIERNQAMEMITQAQAGELLINQGIKVMASWLSGATGVISVDTGLAHLAVALNTPTVILYGPTSKELTGAIGSQHINLQGIEPCIPCRQRTCKITTLSQPLCLANLSPKLVWAAMNELIKNVNN
jgi:heptosyltransferase-1